MRYALKVAYDGTDFCGWQVQANGVSVQQTLSNAAKAAFGEDVIFTASGRTDSGVHALGQVCHADISANIPADRLADALNCHLPQSVAVLASAAAPKGFDANRSAKKKTYVYSMYFSPRRNPLKDRYSVHIKGAINIPALREAASLFVGEHDFKAYCASRSQVKTTVRTVFSVNVSGEGEDVKIEVCGGGFLYNMVRTMVGTMLGYAFGRLSCEDIINSLQTRNRGLVGKTMPARGLMLKEVDYGIDLFDGQPSCKSAFPATQNDGQ